MTDQETGEQDMETTAMDQETGEQDMETTAMDLQAMTAGKHTMKITQEQLAGALARIVLPDSWSGPPGARFISRPTAEMISEAVFAVTRNLQYEASRWVTGELYAAWGRGKLAAGPDRGRWTETLSVYRREDGGWFAYDRGEHFRDGQLDTSRFEHLTFPAPAGGTS